MPSPCTRRIQTRLIRSRAVSALCALMLLLASVPGCGQPADANNATSASKTFTDAVASSTDKTANKHLTVSGDMPLATTGVPFSAAVSVSGGTSPYTFGIIWQALPPGLALSATTGAISGTPTLPGSYQFSVSAADRRGGYG